MYAGIQIVKEEEEQKNAEGCVHGLWNAQPFPPPDSVPLPGCEAGCARAQPLKV